MLSTVRSYTARLHGLFHGVLPEQKKHISTKKSCIVYIPNVLTRFTGNSDPDTHKFCHNNNTINQLFDSSIEGKIAELLADAASMATL